MSAIRSPFMFFVSKKKLLGPVKSIAPRSGGLGWLLHPAIFLLISLSFNVKAQDPVSDSQDESGDVFLSNPAVQDRVRNQKVSPVRDISQNRSTCETAPAATSPAATGPAAIVPAATFSRSKDLVRNLEKETPEVDAEATQEPTLSTGSRLASLIESAHKQREFVVLEEFVANNGMPATKVRTKWRTYCVTTSPETGKKIGLPCPTRITKRR
jgi:hypothetical protein